MKMLDETCLPLGFLGCAVDEREILHGMMQEALIGRATPFACIVGQFFDEWPVNQNVGEGENLWDAGIFPLLQFFQREAGVQRDVLCLCFERL